MCNSLAATLIVMFCIVGSVILFIVYYPKETWETESDFQDKPKIQIVHLDGEESNFSTEKIAKTLENFGSLIVSIGIIGGLATGLGCLICACCCCL